MKTMIETSFRFENETFMIHAEVDPRKQGLKQGESLK